MLIKTICLFLLIPGWALGQETFTQETFDKLTTEMQKKVEALRGWKFKGPVKKEIYSEEQIKAFLSGGKNEKEFGPTARRDALRRMVGLNCESETKTDTFEKMMSEFLPHGVYDHQAHALYVLKPKEDDKDFEGIKTVILHELVHAMDDQYFGLNLSGEKGPKTSDELTVRLSIFEGAAILLQERYLMKKEASGEQKAERDMDAMKSFFKVPLHALIPFPACFPLGSRFLLKGDTMARNMILAHQKDPGSVGPALKQAGTNLPRSTEQLLHPEKYWDNKKQDAPVDLNHEAVEKLLAEEGLETCFKDTLGEILMALLTSPKERKLSPMAFMLPDFWSNEAAAGWGGDGFFLLNPGNLCGIWFTLWDSKEDRDAFIEAYALHRPLETRTLSRLGDRAVVYFYGFDKTKQEAVMKRIRSSPLLFEREGKPWSP